MKSSFIIFCISFFSIQASVSQKIGIKDSIILNEVVVQKEISRRKIKEILKKINYNLKNNYYLGTKNYTTEYSTIKNSKDTLLNHKGLLNLDTYILHQKNLENLFLNSSNILFNKSITAFSRFEPSNSANNWLALSLFYDSLHVLNFDFFDINWGYKYKIVTVGNVSTVKFTASKYFTGQFSFDKLSYNLIQIDFHNTNPYYYNIHGLANDLIGIEFESKWKYNKVSIQLDFKEILNNKLVIEKVNAMQELTEFQFKRYSIDSKSVIDRSKNISFTCNLKMKFLE